MLLKCMASDGIIARAFELARDGTCRTLGEVRNRLTKEGFGNVDGHLAGSSIRKQLAAIFAATK
jgi:hypothetical protein